MRNTPRDDSVVLRITRSDATGQRGAQPRGLGPIPHRALPGRCPGTRKIHGAAGARRGPGSHSTRIDDAPRAAFKAMSNTPTGAGSLMRLQQLVATTWSTCHRWSLPRQMWSVWRLTPGPSIAPSAHTECATSCSWAPRRVRRRTRRWWAIRSVQVILGPSTGALDQWWATLGGSEWSRGKRDFLFFRSEEKGQGPHGRARLRFGGEPWTLHLLSRYFPGSLGYVVVSARSDGSTSASSTLPPAKAAPKDLADMPPTELGDP